MTFVRRAMMVSVVLIALSACSKSGDARSVATDSNKIGAAGNDSAGPTGSASATSAAPGQATAQIPGVSVTTGVYTLTQAARGQEVYASSCAQCHTTGQHSGTQFAAAWNNRRLSDLYDIVHTTMPQDNPGSLSEQDYIDVIAYMLQINRIPAGKIDLRADAAALRDLRIDVSPAAGP